MQIIEVKEAGQLNRRQQIRRFALPEALRKAWAPLLTGHPEAPSTTCRSTPSPERNGAVGGDEGPPGDRPVSRQSTSGQVALADVTQDEGEDMDTQQTPGDPPGLATASSAAPMQTKIMHEKRMRAILTHIEECGFLLHNEIRYVWYLFSKRVRCFCWVLAYRGMRISRAPASDASFMNMALPQPLKNVRCGGVCTTERTHIACLSECANGLLCP